MALEDIVFFTILFMAIGISASIVLPRFVLPKLSKRRIRPAERILKSLRRYGFLFFSFFGLLALFLELTLSVSLPFATLVTAFLIVIGLIASYILPLRIAPRLLRRRGREASSETLRHLRRDSALVFALFGLLALFSELALSGTDTVSPLIFAVYYGAFYAMMGVGLTLTYAVVKLPNFAHGEMVTIGAYVMSVTYAYANFPIWLAFAAAILAGSGLGLAQHLLVYRPLINRKAKIIQIMIASFALSLVIRSIYYMFAAYYNIISFHPISYSPLINPFTKTTLQIGTAPITDLWVATITLTVAMTILMFLLLNRTLIGKSMRAVADNVELAEVTGINVEWVRIFSWLVSGALAGLAGALYGVQFAAAPELGWNALLKVFAAVTLGGLVSFPGTIVGGLIVGFAEQWVTTVSSSSALLLSTSWQSFYVFLIIVIVLLVRPAGLSGLKFPHLRLGVRSALAKRIRRKHAKVQLPKSEVDGGPQSNDSKPME